MVKYWTQLIVVNTLATIGTILTVGIMGAIFVAFAVGLGWLIANHPIIAISLAVPVFIAKGVYNDHKETKREQEAKEAHKKREIEFRERKMLEAKMIEIYGSEIANQNMDFLIHEYRENHI